MMCGYFCIGCTDFMLTGKNLLEYTNKPLRKKLYFFLLFAVSARMKTKNVLKKKKSIEILKIVGLIENI